jgi:hypothetical protein
MRTSDQLEAICLLFDGMSTTNKTLRFTQLTEGSGINNFLGEGFTRKQEQLQELAREATLNYLRVLETAPNLGKIPVKFCFNTEEEFAAEIVEFTRFGEDRWHYKYMVPGHTERFEGSDTIEGLKEAFWASIVPAVDQPKS